MAAAIGAANAGLTGRLEAVKGSVPPQSRKIYEAMLGWLSGDRTALANVQAGSFAFDPEKRDEALLGVIRRQTSLLEDVSTEPAEQIALVSTENIPKSTIGMRFFRLATSPFAPSTLPEGSSVEEAEKIVEGIEEKSGDYVEAQPYPQVSLESSLGLEDVRTNLNVLHFKEPHLGVTKSNAFAVLSPCHNLSVVKALFSYLETGQGLSKGEVWFDSRTRWVIKLDFNDQERGLAILSDALSRLLGKELKSCWNDFLKGKTLLRDGESIKYSLLFQDSQCWGDLPMGGPKCFSSYLMEGLNSLEKLADRDLAIAEEIKRHKGDVSKMITPQNNLLVFGVVNRALSQIFVNRMRMNPGLQAPVNRNLIWIMSEVHFEEWHPVKILHMGGLVEESSTSRTISSMWRTFGRLTGMNFSRGDEKPPEISSEFVEFVQAAKKRQLAVFTIIHQRRVDDSNLTQVEWRLQETEENFFSMVQSLRGDLFKEQKETFNELMSCLWGEFNPENENRSCDLPLIVLQAGNYKEVFERLCSFVHERHFRSRHEILSLGEQIAFIYLVYAYQRYEMIFRLNEASKYQIGFMGAHSKHGANSASNYVFDGLLDFVYKRSYGPDPTSPQVLAERLEEVMRLQAIRPGAVRYDEQLSAMQAVGLLLEQAETSDDTLKAFAEQFSTGCPMTRASSCNPRAMACLKVRTSGVIGQIFEQKAMREMHYKPPHDGIIEMAQKAAYRVKIDLREVDYVGESELLAEPTMTKLLPLLQVGVVQAKVDLYRELLAEICRDAEKKVVVTYDPASESLSCLVPVIYQDDDDEVIAHLECETILTNVTFDEDEKPHANVTVGWHAVD